MVLFFDRGDFWLVQEIFVLAWFMQTGAQKAKGQPNVRVGDIPAVFFGDICVSCKCAISLDNNI